MSHRPTCLRPSAAWQEDTTPSPMATRAARCTPRTRSTQRFKQEGVLSGKVRGHPAAQTTTEVLGLGLDACAARLGLPGSEGPALDPLLPCPLFSCSRGGHTHTLSEGGAPPSCSPTPSLKVELHPPAAPPPLSRLPWTTEAAF